MSYILEALRKSDAQRRRGAPPALVTPQPAAVTHGPPRTLPYRGLLAAALVGAGIVIGVWRPWQAEPPAPATDAAKIKPLAPAQVPLPSPQPLPEPATVALKPQTPAPARVETRTQAREPSRKVAAAVPKKAAQEANVIAFSDLPVPVQQEIPALSISAHAYSAVPKERLIGINDRVLREGAQVTPNLLLEEITPDGMIMSYKGYRFRRGVR